MSPNTQGGDGDLSHPVGKSCSWPRRQPSPVVYAFVVLSAIAAAARQIGERFNLCRGGAVAHAPAVSTVRYWRTHSCGVQHGHGSLSGRPVPGQHWPAPRQRDAAHHGVDERQAPRARAPASSAPGSDHPRAPRPVTAGDGHAVGRRAGEFAGHGPRWLLGVAWSGGSRARWTRHRDQRFGGEPELVERPGDREGVGSLAKTRTPSSAAPRGPPRGERCAEVDIADEGHGDEVRHHAARPQQAEAAVAVADEVAQPRTTSSSTNAATGPPCQTSTPWFVHWVRTSPTIEATSGGGVK